MTYYGPAIVNNEGVLAQWVQQPVSNTPSESGGVIKLNEQWKGPYETGKNILNNVHPDEALSALHTFLGIDRVSRIAAPSAPLINGVVSEWIITAIRVDELQAGSHCLINVECEARVGYTQENLTQIDESSTWNISWQSYSVSPWEFCSGVVHEPIVISPSNTLDEPDWTLPASRTEIDAYNSHSPTIVYDSIEERGLKAYAYTPDIQSPEYRLALSPAEVEVLKKVNLGRNAIYHYPIVTHSTSFIGKTDTSFSEELGGQLDTITTLPTDCPYKFSKVKVGNGEVDWVWIKIADDMTQTKTRESVRYDRRQVWAGYTDVDENFYGTKTFSRTEEGITQGRWFKNCL